MGQNATGHRLGRTSRPGVESLEGRELLSHAAVDVRPREAIVQAAASAVGYRVLPFRGNVTYQVSLTPTKDPNIYTASYYGYGYARPLGAFTTAASYNVSAAQLSSYASRSAVIPNVPYEVDFTSGEVLTGTMTISSQPTRRNQVNVQVNGQVTGGSESLAGVVGNFGGRGRLNLSTGLLNASLNGRLYASNLPR